MLHKNHYIFDLDDTLTNSYSFNQQMFVETFWPFAEKIDETIVRDIHRANRGKGMKLQFEEVVRAHQLQVTPEELEKYNQELHRKHVERISLFSGVQELLEMLTNAKKTISICTNRDQISTRMILKKNNMEKYFANVISCRDKGFEKPDPKCLLDLISDSQISSVNTIYFGDSETDYLFAKNAGIDAIIIDQYLNDHNFYLNLVKAFL